MLPSASRLRAAPDWAALRRGTSSGRGSVVVKVARIEGPGRVAALAVSKSVGGAVVRNTVKRRLRTILSGLLPDLPSGTGILVRALPAAASTPYSVLATDVREATQAALRKGAS